MILVTLCSLLYMSVFDNLSLSRINPTRRNEPSWPSGLWCWTLTWMSQRYELGSHGGNDEKVCFANLTVLSLLGIFQTLLYVYIIFLVSI